MSDHLTTGLHQIEEDAYHADPCERPSLSSTLAKTLLARSPLHAWTESRRLNPEWEPKEAKHFDIGKAAHSEILGKGQPHVEIPPHLLASNGAASTKAARDFIEDARAAGMVPLKGEEIEAITRMAQSAHRFLGECGISISPSRSEMAAIAEIDGAMCRALFDNVPVDPLPGVGPIILDIKTCENAAPEACLKAVEAYEYSIQWMHYRETLKAATGEDRAFLFLFVEKAPPHGCCLVKLRESHGHSGDWSEPAAAEIRRARLTWAECVETNHWPCYPAGITELAARPFFRERLEDRGARAEILRPSRQTLDAARRFQSPN